MHLLIHLVTQSDLSGHDVQFDDDRSGDIMIRAFNNEYLDVMTRRADMIQLRTLKSTERSGLAASPHYKAGRSGLRIMGGADKCKDLGAPMKMARLYQVSSHILFAFMQSLTVHSYTECG